MKTHVEYEVGDKLVIEATREYGVCTHNSLGGTISMPVGTPLLVKVVKAWQDDEIGQRYIGRTEDGRELFFGLFDVNINLARYQTK